MIYNGRKVYNYTFVIYNMILTKAFCDKVNMLCQENVILKVESLILSLSIGIKIYAVVFLMIDG